MHAAIYIRVSTDEQAERGLSLEVQEARCREQAERHGATAITVYRDDGHSSLTAERPALQRLLADLPALDRVYVLDQSRWSRDPRDLEELRERLLAQNVVLVPLASPLDQSSPQGQFVSRVEAAADRYAVDVARAKTIASLRARAEAGHHHGQEPLGYRRPRDAAGGVVHDAPLEVVPGEAETVRRIHRRYAAGASLAQIARELNADGVPGKRGRITWSLGTLDAILRHAVYTGVVEYHGDEFPAAHEPILDAETWALVQRRLALAGVDRRRRRRGSIAGLMVCGVCGGSVHYTRAGRESSNAYRCAARLSRPRPDRHDPIFRSSAAVDDAIWAATQALFSSEAYAAALSRPEGASLEAPPSPSRGTGSPARAPCPPSAPVDLPAEIAELEQAIAYNLAAARAGAIPPDLLARENAPLLARRAELQARQRLADLPPALAGPMPQDPAALIAELRDLPYSGQLTVLEALYEMIELHHEGLVLHHALALPPRGVRYGRWRGWRLGWSPPTLDWRP